MFAERQNLTIDIVPSFDIFSDGEIGLLGVEKITDILVVDL